MIINELSTMVSDAFEQCGYEKTMGSVKVSDRQDLCQFQCNGAFDGAKKFKKPPFVIADDVVKILSNNAKIKAVESVKPGFINITVTDEYLTEKISEIQNDIHLGIPQAEKKERILLDYGGANVAKPLHIGHLRTAIIGESLKRIAKAMGFEVTTDVHLGDWGLQIGLVIAELEERNSDQNIIEIIRELSLEDFNTIYPLASLKSKSDNDFREKAKRITAELQNRNAVYIEIWNEIMKISLPDLKKNYNNLNVDFDYWYGESDTDKYVPELLSILEDKGLMYESNGAMIVDVLEETDTAPMPPILIKKSDNSILYATTDLATIVQRQKDFKPDRYWYVTDKRQNLHFTQVFRCAKKAGIVPENTSLEHLGIGTMNGNDGKPYKTRDGGVMQLSDFISEITNAAISKINESEAVSAEDRLETARKIAIAAVKFGDLCNQPLKDYIFDIDRFLSFDGKTGTYLIYTVTRINSILKKLNINDSNTNINHIYTDTERDIYLNIMLTGLAFERAFEEKTPSAVCDNAFRLASLFSAFYHDNHINNEQDNEKKSNWISLCVLVRKMLLLQLDALGIESVECM